MEAEGVFRAREVPPGSYRLELCSRYGREMLGPLTLDRGQELDLGVVTFAPPALLALRGAHGIDMRVEHVLSEVDARCWAGARDTVLALPPGTYRVTARVGEGARELVLSSGETRELSLARAADEVFFRDGAARARVQPFDRADAVESWGGTCLQCHE